MNIITIFLDIEDYELDISSIVNNNYWKFYQKEFFLKNGRGPFVSTYLDVFKGDKGYFEAGKNALKELIRIIQLEQLNLGRINYHYSYYYESQCNIEFDEEYIKLFSELNCFITIICAKEE